MRIGTILAAVGLLSLTMVLFWRTFATDQVGPVSDDGPIVAPTSDERGRVEVEARDGTH